MKKRIIAVFDLDGTLTTVRSVESAFFQYLLVRRKLTIRNLLNSGGFYCRNILTNPLFAVKKNKMYLKGITTNKVAMWAQEFIKENRDTLLHAKYLQLVKSHKDMGHTTILITGSPDILVTHLLKSSWFDHVYAIELETEDGIYTGRVSGNYYYGRAKKNLIICLTDELDAELTRSYCYADSKSDIEMMSLFGHPVAVSPDPYLRRRALKNNWEILY